MLLAVAVCLRPAATEMQRDETASGDPIGGGIGVSFGVFDVRGRRDVGESGNRVELDDDRPRRRHPFGRRAFRDAWVRCCQSRLSSVEFAG